MKSGSAAAPVTPPRPPRIRLSLGVTGHRSTHRLWQANRDGIAAALREVLDRFDAVAQAAFAALEPGAVAPTRLNSLLAIGTDHLASHFALERGYDLAAALPFGPRLNAAINALPNSADDVRALLAGGEAADGVTEERAQAIFGLVERARALTLADRDGKVEELLLAHLEQPDDHEIARLYHAESSRQVAAASSILIEQSDLLVAVWDGHTTAHPGGTGHTVAKALDLGAPVVWIDPAAPADWRVLRAPEALVHLETPHGDAIEALDRVVGEMAAAAAEGYRGGLLMAQEKWHPRSARLAQAYRRVEAMFGEPLWRGALRSLDQHYETPEQIGTGSAGELLASMDRLPGGEPGMREKIEREVLRRFAWADGVSANLSDDYRGGMTTSFVLSSLAIIGGLAYLPLVAPEGKWAFALFELVVLAAIVGITIVGQRRKWHSRWLETRRVAEYLRHSPLLLILGTARAPGHWPTGTETSWPENYARQAIREVGLPDVTLTTAYLRAVLSGPLANHVTSQRDYHLAKAARLAKVHHKLDRLSDRLFQLAIASVAIYLALKLGETAGWVDGEGLAGAAKWFTLAGVAFPTLGAAVAGIRYFGDFERFAAISRVTAAKLGSIAPRIEMLASGPDEEISYCRVVDLVQSADDVVFAEIESWQAVFGSKQITVPV